MERQLPAYNIEGTDFIVDVSNLRLYEKANPGNSILLSDMRDVGDGYVLEYSIREKNVPSFAASDDEIRVIKIPELVQLDPPGMAEKYGCSIGDIQGTTDFDLMVDQQALQRRLSGQLPTVAIAGHTFYVDIRMGMLRPKDDFSSPGIVLSEIDDHYFDNAKEYIIPYDPKIHGFREPDYETITSFPKDLIVVAFAHEGMLDPVGFNRKQGFDELSGLKEVKLQSHFDAKIIDWKDTGINNVIQRNIDRRQKKESEQQSVRRRRSNRL